MNPKRERAANAGVGCIAVLALGLPLLLGLLAYLAVTDGIGWNEGDPLREGRVWMIKENRNFTGLGLQWHTDGSIGAKPCARSHYLALKWSPGPAIDRSTRECI
jgi:hypothetical protein